MIEDAQPSSPSPPGVTLAQPLDFEDGQRGAQIFSFFPSFQKMSSNGENSWQTVEKQLHVVAQARHHLLFYGPHVRMGLE
jgi:hypothetical protein